MILRMRRGAPLRRRALALPAALAASVLLLAGCGSGETPTSSGDTQFPQGTGLITDIPAGKRVKAPDIEGKTVDGEQLELSDYRGKVVVLNVWGSWCAPCRAETPHLVKAAEEMKDDGVEFVGINTRDQDAANAQAFERTYDVPYPSLFDPDGRLIRRFPANALSFQTIPSTVVLDRQGRIAVSALAELDEKELRDMVRPVADET